MVLNTLFGEGYGLSKPICRSLLLSMNLTYVVWVFSAFSVCFTVLQNGALMPPKQVCVDRPRVTALTLPAHCCALAPAGCGKTAARGCCYRSPGQTDRRTPSVTYILTARSQHCTRVWRLYKTRYRSSLWLYAYAWNTYLAKRQSTTFIYHNSTESDL